MRDMATPAPTNAPIGILCALADEMRLFREATEDARTEKRGGTEVVTGRLDGIAVVLAEAGIGKVNAAVTAAIEGMWEGYLAMPPSTLADTLLLADQLAPVESPLSQLAGYGRQGTEVHIDVALDDETLSSILEESAAEVASLVAALRA